MTDGGVLHLIMVHSFFFILSRMRLISTVYIYHIISTHNLHTPSPPLAIRQYTMTSIAHLDFATLRRVNLFRSCVPRFLI